MNDPVKSVARRLKGLREMSHISIEEMAEATGLSNEDYELCEGGRQNLTLAFLVTCADYLGVDVSEIVTGKAPKLSTYTICRSGNGMPVKRREGFEYKHLASALKNRLAEPCVVVVKYDAVQENAPVNLTTHAGQEFDYVLEGSLRIFVNGHEEILHAGDSIYFDATNEHGQVALGGTDCKFLAIGIKGDESEDNMPIQVEPTTEPVQLATKDNLLYKKFVQETLDEEGRLQAIDFQIPEHFNFGFDVVDKLASKKPNKLAMLWESGEHEVRRFSFQDISKYSSKTANLFKQLGIRKGDRVMLILKRHYEFWFCMVALCKLGAVAIPATNQLTEKDIEYRFNAAGVKAIVCTGDGEVAEAVEAALPHSPTVELKIMVNGEREGWLNFDQETAPMADVFPRPQGEKATKSTDPMLMYFTSGTTGYPKIAEHDFTYPIGHIVTARWWHNVNPNGLHFAISDSGWGKAAWGKIYGQWLCESAIFTYDFDRFHADDILKLFAKHHITTFCAPPTMYRMFIKEDLSKYDLSSLEYSCTAGEALNAEVYYQWEKATGLKIMEGFGQTETTLVLGNLIGTVPKPGSMGKPNPQYHVLLVGRDNKPVKPGEVGEIVLDTSKGHPCGMFEEYYRNEELTKEAWHDNLYHTGDTAWCDEEGYFWYVGRTDDIIKSSGYRIGPFEIESVLMELPYVLECAITGVPDPVRGQVVKATIVLTKGTEGSDKLKKEIQKYVKERTAPYKYPRVVEFVQELPKTVSGKIRRVEIRNGDQ